MTAHFVRGGLSVVLVATLAACGDSSELSCGPGTVQVGDVCVPTDPGGTGGAGGSTGGGGTGLGGTGAGGMGGSGGEGGTGGDEPTCDPEAALDFKIAMLPDTQHYSDSATNIALFEAQTQWIVANAVTESLSFVTLVGDIVQSGGSGSNNNQVQWSRADGAMAYLDGDLNNQPDGLIAYAAIAGNHDYDVVADKATANQYLTTFGPSRFAGRSWLLGAAPNQLNMAQLFFGDPQSGCQPYLHLGLEWLPADEAIEWAQDIIMANPDVPVVVSTHQYLTVGNPGSRSTVGETVDSGGDNGAESLYRKLVEPFPQVFLVLSGHYSGDGRLTSTTALDQSVHQVLADYQSDPNGGNGWMQLIELRASNSEIELATFSPTYVSGTTAGPDRTQSAESNYAVGFDLVSHRGWLETHRIVHFRQAQDSGFGTYWGAEDTHVGDGGAGVTNPSTVYATADNIRIDGDSDNEQGLLRFSALFGTDPGQIPLGTPIVKAVLTLTTEGPAAHSANGGRLHRMTIPWDEYATFESLGNGVQLPAEALSAHDADSAGAVNGKGTDSFDVTVSLQAWSNGETNYGWVLIANDTDRWEFRSSDWGTLVERPMLTVVHQ